MRHNKKGNKKLQKNGNREKNSLWTEKDKIYDNNNWKRETRTNRRRGKGKIDEIDTYSYLGIMLNKESNLKEHIKETGNKASRIIREMNGISSKQNVGQEEIRLKIKLFETCLVPAMLYGFEVWGKISKSEMQAIEKIQNQSLKKILQLAVTTSST